MSPLLIRWSDDGAASWRSRPLPLDLQPLAAKISTLSVGNAKVAAGAQEVIVVAVGGGRWTWPRSCQRVSPCRVAGH